MYHIVTKISLCSEVKVSISHFLLLHFFLSVMHVRWNILYLSKCTNSYETKDFWHLSILRNRIQWDETRKTVAKDVMLCASHVILLSETVACIKPEDACSCSMAHRVRSSSKDQRNSFNCREN